jgi:hypothetical protein
MPTLGDAGPDADPDATVTGRALVAVGKSRTRNALEDAAGATCNDDNGTGARST